MTVTKIETSAYFIQPDRPDGAAPTGTQVWTEGIGECVALAVRGKTPKGEVGTCFAHLDSRQYLIPRRGGKMDHEVPSVREVKEFIRQHPDDPRCLAATNCDLGLSVRGNIKVRYGLTLTEIKQLHAGGNSGVVTLDVDRFKMYACKPDEVCESKSIDCLPRSSKRASPSPPHRTVLQRVWQAVCRGVTVLPLEHAWQSSVRSYAARRRA